jgi:hypothetical protein
MAAAPFTLTAESSSGTSRNITSSTLIWAVGVASSCDILRIPLRTSPDEEVSSPRHNRPDLEVKISVHPIPPLCGVEEGLKFGHAVLKLQMQDEGFLSTIA